jgi:hypothetical protein
MALFNREPDKNVKTDLSSAGKDGRTSRRQRSPDSLPRPHG